MAESFEIAGTGKNGKNYKIFDKTVLLFIGNFAFEKTDKLNNDMKKIISVLAIILISANMAKADNPTRLTDGLSEIKQTAGRNALGDFAPKFAQLNDDVLFGEVWSRTDKLSLRDRSIVTVTALVSSGIIDSSLTYHLQEAKKNGVTRNEIAEILTQIAFYAGWPKAWGAFRQATEV